MNSSPTSSLAHHFREVLTKASRAVVIKIAAAALSFLMYMIIGRTLGASESGLYFLAFSIVQILSTVGRAGTERSATRFVASAAENDDWATVKGVYVLITKYTGLASLALGLLCFLLAGPVSRHIFSKPELTPVLRIMSVSVPFFSMIWTNAFSLQGLRKTDQSVFFQSMCLPACILTLIILDRLPFTLMDAAWIFTFSSVAGCVWSYLVWRRHSPELRGIKGTFSSKELRTSCVPLFLAAVLGLTHRYTAELCLGAWEESAFVAYYATAYRAAYLMIFLLLAFNSILAPKIAALHSKGDMVTLCTLMRKSSLVMSLVAAPGLALFLLFPKTIMGLFGHEFQNAAQLLQILSIGQFVNVMTGASAPLLIMSGNETLFRNVTVISAAAGIVLCLVLIPSFGATGAALSATLGLAVHLLLSVYIVYTRLGIVIIPFLPQPAIRDSLHAHAAPQK